MNDCGETQSSPCVKLEMSFVLFDDASLRIKLTQ